MAALAKLTPPKIAGAFPRQRLFESLDACRESAVVWICGPPGAGKTTLVASYVDARKLRPLWYRVDEGDADPATLFYYLGIAARQLTPRKKKPLPLFTPEYAKGLPAFTRNYFRELFERLPQPCFMVFDNYQDAGSSSRVHELMQYALAEIPEHGNVIVISRAEPPVELTRLRASNALQLVNPESMRLTVEEARGVVRSRTGNTLDDEAIDRVAQQTQGWAAGIILLCEIGGAIKPAAPTRGCAQLQTIFDYFAGEILSRADSETQDVLFTTALMPMITASLAETLTGRQRAAQILEQLYRSNYFTLRDSQAEPVYQYHPLFREFLLTRAKSAYTTARLKELQSTAADLLAAANQSEYAAELFTAAENWRGLAQVILRAAEAMLSQGRDRGLRDWIERLPPEELNADVAILNHLGTCYLSLDPRKARTIFESAFALARKNRDAAGVYTAWSRISQAIRFDPSFDFRPLDAWVAMFEELQREYPVFPSPEIEAVVTSRMFYSLAIHIPHHPDVKAWEKRATAILQSSLNSAIRLEICMSLAFHHLFVGDFARAAVEVALVKDLAQRQVYVIPTTPGFLQAYYEWLTGSFQDSIATCLSMLELARTTGIHVHDFHLLTHGMTASLVANDLKIARQFLEQLLPHFEGTNLFARSYRYVASWYAFLNGDKAAALSHAEASLAAVTQTGLPYIEINSRYGLAIVLHDAGRLKEAQSQLAQGLKIAQGMSSAVQEHACKLVEADFAFQAGDRASAIQALRRALTLGRRHGFVNGLWISRTMMTRLFGEALAAGIEVDYVRKLIKSCALPPPDAEIEHWPWPIKITTLGGFSVSINDEPLAFSRKAPKKPIALLKAIIAFGGRNVSDRKLIDALWRDEEGDVAHESLSVTVHRLRRLLGDSEAIQVHEGKVSLDQSRCWTDVRAFEHLLESAATSDSQPLEINLYRGAFLPDDVDEPWTVSMRERLRARFIRHSTAAGKRLTDNGQWERAIECYLRALEADDLAEELYQGAMRCYQHLDRRAEALALYRRMRQTLSVTLGVSPSAASEALYRSLGAEQGGGPQYR